MHLMKRGNAELFSIVFCQKYAEEPFWFLPLNLPYILVLDNRNLQNFPNNLMLCVFSHIAKYYTGLDM